MPLSTPINTPLTINMPLAAQSTGWSVDGVNATHESCNAGYISIKLPPLVIGDTYTVTYSVPSVSNGYLRLFGGSRQGVQRTAPGFYTEQITISGDGILRFYSNADCVISLISYQNNKNTDSQRNQKTIAFSEKTNKWVSFRTFNPEMGFSLFRNLYTFKNGQMYVHEQNSANRNNLFGTPYNSTIKFVANAQLLEVKHFTGMDYKGNELLVTTTDGIVTSLGQISELIADDFLQTKLSDGATVINIYDKEGIFQAAFLRDKNIDLIEGDVLKGNYITIELVTTNNNILRLFSVDVNYSISHNGV